MSNSGYSNDFILNDVWDSANHQLAVTSSPGSAAPGVDSSHPAFVRGQLVRVSVEFARPAGTGTYTANYVVSNNGTTTTMMEFANFARLAGGDGYIVGAKLITDKKSITPRFRVHLFLDNTAVVSGDNAAWQEKYTDSAKRIGYFDLPAMTTGADTTNSDMSRSLDMTLRMPFFVGVASRSVYAVLETLDAFAFASAEKFTLTLYGDLN